MNPIVKAMLTLAGILSLLHCHLEVVLCGLQSSRQVCLQQTQDQDTCELPSRCPTRQ